MHTIDHFVLLWNLFFAAILNATLNHIKSYAHMFNLWLLKKLFVQLESISVIIFYFDILKI